MLDSSNPKCQYSVIASLIDWENAFPRQCPKLGVQAFINCGVRPSLVPGLTIFFQDREIVVKWHGALSKPRKINGGGPQGAALGILEYIAQSNNCADFVDSKDKFRFVDDLTILEVVNILTIGLSTFNLKNQVPNDVPISNKFISASNLKLKNT